MNNINCAETTESASISVITCTNRLNYIDNVLNNFLNQQYQRKQLIIILNNNLMDITAWENKIEQFNNIKIYQLDENVSLGECLNFGISKSDYEFIAKFDDDDYYAPQYLSDSIKAFTFAEAGIVGKASTYVFFEDNNILALRGIGKENCYVKYVDGPTMIMKREVFNHVKFRPINRGEDKNFCIDCKEKGIKIFSTNRFHHVYVRHATAQQHTWSIENSELLKWCKIVAEGVIDYKKCISIEHQ